MPPPPLLMQTTYAELLDRCRATAFHEAFPQDGAFVAKTIKGKRYWYFQQSSAQGRQQKYVGPETPELLDQISQHRQMRDDERERRALVSTLVRAYGLQRPPKEIGDIIAALAKAGVFRLRGILVGTVAYQTYAPMLGKQLPHSILQTGDVDIAQFKNVSVAVGDQTPPLLEILKTSTKHSGPFLTFINAMSQATFPKVACELISLLPTKDAIPMSPSTFPHFKRTQNRFGFWIS